MAWICVVARYRRPTFPPHPRSRHCQYGDGVWLCQTSVQHIPPRSFTGSANMVTDLCECRTSVPHISTSCYLSHSCFIPFVLKFPLYSFEVAYMAWICVVTRYRHPACPPHPRSRHRQYGDGNVVVPYIGATQSTLFAYRVRRHGEGLTCVPNIGAMYFRLVCSIFYFGVSPMWRRAGVVTKRWCHVFPPCHVLYRGRAIAAW
jgi:hypothetical protein